MTDPSDPGVAGLLTAEKQALRRQLLARRGERTLDERARAQDANGVHALAAVAHVETVCAFLPLASEPLSLSLLTALLEAGHRVLVPVVTGAAPLDWVEHVAGAVPVPGALGLARPDGPTLGGSAVRDAGAVLVPALAIDGRGYRLGRGGGHYDRSLALLPRLSADRPTIIGVIYDDEQMDFVPADALDIPVDQLICPIEGLVPLG